MSAIGDTSDATTLAAALADAGRVYERSPLRTEEVVREAVAALRASVPVDRRVAEAFDALLSTRLSREVGAVVDDVAEADAAVVVEAISTLDRARTDLFRVLRAWMGESTLDAVAPQVRVREFTPNEFAARGAVPLRVAYDDEFRMMVPKHVAEDPVLLMAVFAEQKRRVSRATGGDFGPDAADPDHYRGCPVRTSGNPEDCECLSGAGQGRPKRMAVAADGARFVIIDSDNLVPESDPTGGGMDPQHWRGLHGALRELFLPGSVEPLPYRDRVWVLAEVERNPEAPPFRRRGAMSNAPDDWWWERGGHSYGWDLLNTVPLVSDVIGATS